MIEITRGSEEHRAACLAIAKGLPQCFTGQAIAAMADSLREHRLYVALDSDQVVGFATIELMNTDPVAEISWIAVRPERQREGVGSLLIGRIAGDLRAQRVRFLKVKTLASNAEYPPYEITRRFYKKMDFIHLETVVPYPGWEPDNPCAIYVKAL